MALFLNFPSWIDPYVFSFLPIRWYALMYIVAFVITYVLFRYQVRHDGIIEMSADESQSLFFSAILGLIIGARVFSCLFYSDTTYYLTHPWEMFWPFQNGHFVGLPGMSYHGGVVGCFIGGLIYTRRHKRSILEVTDIIIAGLPLGYTFGRLGNFINGELYGRVTTSPVGMIFPNAEKFSTAIGWVRDTADKVGISYSIGDYVNLPRYPTQLFEAFFEGIVLFLILFFIFRPLKIKKHLKHGTLFSLYLLFYGLFRFVIEYFREPDSNIGYVISLGKGSDNIALFTSVLNISKGQIFCALMILSAILLLVFVNIKGERYDCRREDRKIKGKAKGK